MAIVRILKELLRDKEIGKRIVPIIPDEARTFGMDSWFPSLKIYNRNGQLYTSVDAELMLAYKESPIGQILHEGINEAGSTASFTAVGTSYATHGEPMIPLYIFYSMFGFQRTGDGLWAAADQMARGFVLGATAGRTTLTGEGLQHADGHSLLLASTNPAAVTYDAAFSYELAHIVKDGLRRMYGGTEGVDGFGGENIFYYLTIYNEPYVQPAEPEGLDVEGLLKGIYLYKTSEAAGPKAQILVSGVAMPEGLRAQKLLADEWGVSADVWSVTSWGELRREGVECERQALLNPSEDAPVPFVTTALSSAQGPCRRGFGLDAGGLGPDPSVGSRRLHHARHGRVRLLRHPHRCASLLQRRCRIHRRCRADRFGEGRIDRAVEGRRSSEPIPHRRRECCSRADRGHR